MLVITGDNMSLVIKIGLHHLKLITGLNLSFGNNLDVSEMLLITGDNMALVNNWPCSFEANYGLKP